MDANLQKSAEEKAVRLIDYLFELGKLRITPIRDFKEYKKILWLSDIPKQKNCFTQAWGRDENYDSDIWLEIKTRPEPSLPAIPPECEGWVDISSLRNKKDIPELSQTKREIIEIPKSEDEKDRIERLEEHPEVQKAWDRYLDEKWLPWVDEHDQWEKEHKIYSTLFAINQEQLRLGEEYELVLGLGLLTWKTPSGVRVQRHLIVADAILEFEPRLGKFTVRTHPEGANLRPELEMLEVEEQPLEAVKSAEISLANCGDPWDRSCIEGVLQALVHSLSDKGEYDNTLRKKDIRASDKPVVEYAPALILRKRSIKGLTETLKRIKEGIEQGNEIPSEFADLCEVTSNVRGDISKEQKQEFDGEIFFPKPSNSEQRSVINKLRLSTGVLVQGPPGTGKSHTIANLICHLLATGQRILITAKTPRALQVLQRLIPSELRPLCISALGAGPEERRSLEASVNGILRKNEEWNEDKAKKARNETEETLNRLKEEKIQIERRLRTIRESETHTQIVAGGTYRGTAAQIAKDVNKNRSKFQWLQDRIPLNKSCPFSTTELIRLINDLRYFKGERYDELKQLWPEKLPSTEIFRDLVKDENNEIQKEHIEKKAANEDVAELLAALNSVVINNIKDISSRILDEIRRLKVSSYSWVKEALNDVLGGNSEPWKEIANVTSKVVMSVEPLVEVADENMIEIPNSVNLRTLYEDALKLKKYLQDGGKLRQWGIFRPQIVKERKYVLDILINGKKCSSLKDFSILCDSLYVRIQLKKAWRFWEKRAGKAPDEPYTLQLSELKSMNNVLKEVLELEKLVAECSKILETYNVQEPVWSDETQVKKLVASCRLAQILQKKKSIFKEFQRIENSVSSIIARGNAHPISKKILEVVRKRDAEGYAEALNRIKELTEDQKRLHALNKMLEKLEQELPNLAKELQETCDQPYWEDRLKSINDAWCWVQAREWIEEYIRKDDVPALEIRLKQIDEEIHSAIAKLASLYAWSFCFSRLKEEERQHMEAWRQAMRRLGKGTGKYARRYRRDAQQHLNKCREAVPAWVMPLHRVWDTVDPKSGMFDVIIVDEASQCGIEAVPLFYLGKKILIVGDDKQISPEAVGLPREAVHQLMEKYLFDFEFKSSFDVDGSLFDHGKRLYGTRRITLREHFRCMPEIIRFSNDLCYRDTPLIPLRQYGPDRLMPIKHFFVEGGYREGRNDRVINRPEAEAIVEKIVELCSDERYANKSMGVVVLQGNAQARLIETLLLDRLGADEIQRRRLVCGNPYSFQGDERDVIFLSMVAASNERIGPLTKAPDERRFNVAASRARDQMWLFYSVQLDELSEKDLRKKLLEFFLNSKPIKIAGIDKNELERRAKKDNRNLVKPPKPFESWFEVDVALELLRKGYRVIPQFEVAGKRIDLVVEGGQARLAVECDGDRWHGPDRYEEDMQRQRQLERCGWEFFRVRESAFYADPEAALHNLWPMLEERGILPIENFQKFNNERNEPESIYNKIEERKVNCQNYNRRAVANNKREEVSVSTRRGPEDVTEKEIEEAIINVLSKCPNYSCTLKSITSRVLKEVNVSTRGEPRRLFEKRVLHALDILEGKKILDKYKVKNERIRLRL